MHNLHGYEQAQKTLRANLSPRFAELHQLEAYVRGTQYEGKQHWLAPTEDVPLLERAPNVVDPIVGNAIQSYCDLMIGEGRWPAITSGADEDDEAFDDLLGLGEEDSALLDAGLCHIAKQARLQDVARKALGEAMTAGTAVTIASVKRGKLCLESTKAKWCRPTWRKDDRSQLAELEIRYPYLSRYYNEHERKWGVEVLLYRRVLTTAKDITYKPAKASRHGEEPDSWAAETTVAHDFGFVPAVWYAFDSGTDVAGEDDGKAIHARLLDEIDALNRACSQHNRAGLYAGDPQYVELGVDESHNPAPMGQHARPMAVYADESPLVKAEHAKWALAGTGSGGSTQSRRKGPGIVWRYPQSESKVAMLTLPGDALDSVAKDRDDLRAQIADALGYVRTDLDALKGPRGGLSIGGLSGEAMSWLYRKQTSRCDGYRSDFEAGWLLPVVNVLLRVVLHFGATGTGSLYLTGAPAVAGVLARFCRPVGDASGGDVRLEWFAPSLRVKWPPYFPPSSDDNAKVSQQARDDHAAGLITLRTAVERIASQYGIGDVEAYLGALQAEQHASTSGLHSAIENLRAQTEANPAAVGADAPQEPDRDAGNRGAVAAGSASRSGDSRRRS